MNIVHVNLGGPPASVDGIAVIVSILASAQSEGGNQVHSFTDDDHPARGLLRGVVAAWKLRKRVIATNPDVVHFHSVYRPAHGLLAMYLRSRDIPYFVSPHSGLSTGSLQRQRLRKYWYLRLIDRRTLEKATTIVCLSAVEAVDVKVSAPRASTAVVPNPSAAPLEQRATTTRVDQLISLCRFDVEQKGLDLLVEIARSTPELRFRVFGETDLNDPDGAESLIASAPSNITFEAAVHGQEKEALLLGARAYIQTSRWEGQSVSVLEALAAGTPCIVSRYIAATLGELSESVVVVSDDPHVAAHQVRDALADEARLEMLAASARGVILEKHSVESVRASLDRVYAAATAHSPHP